MTAFSSLTGRLLVAMPGIDDDRFRHAVILICAHDDEHAMGLRLDQPAPGVSLSEVLKKLDTPNAETVSDRSVLIGGPVERERGFVLHTDDWSSDEASMTFGDGLALTGTRDRNGRRVRYSCRLGSVTPHARVSVSEHLILPAFMEEAARLAAPAFRPAPRKGETRGD